MKILFKSFMSGIAMTVFCKSLNLDFSVFISLMILFIILLGTMEEILDKLSNK